MPKSLSSTILSDEPCPLPGCRDRRMKSNLVCLHHSVEIWQNVQAVNGDPLVHETMVESLAERERRQREADRKRIEFNKQHGTIYYIQVDEKIKIGWTSNLQQRVMAYPPHMVLLTAHLGNRADERDLHRTFKPSRASGREWYHPTQELLDHIERIRAANLAEAGEQPSEYARQMFAWSERQLKNSR